MSNLKAQWSKEVTFLDKCFDNSKKALSKFDKHQRSHCHQATASHKITVPQCGVQRINSLAVLYETLTENLNLRNIANEFISKSDSRGLILDNSEFNFALDVNLIICYFCYLSYGLIFILYFMRTFPWHKKMSSTKNLSSISLISKALFSK